MILRHTFFLSGRRSRKAVMCIVKLRGCGRGRICAIAPNTHENTLCVRIFRSEIKARKKERELNEEMFLDHAIMNRTCKQINSIVLRCNANEMNYEGGLISHLKFINKFCVFILFKFLSAFVVGARCKRERCRIDAYQMGHSERKTQQQP